jgi:hypothetical protein
VLDDPERQKWLPVAAVALPMARAVAPGGQARP